MNAGSDKKWSLERPAESQGSSRPRTSLYADILRDFLESSPEDMPEAAVRLNQGDLPLEEQKTPKAIFAGLYKAAKAVAFQYDDGTPMVRVTLRKGEPVLIRTPKQ